MNLRQRLKALPRAYIKVGWITNRLTQNKSVTNMNKTDQTKHKMIVPFMYYIRFGLKHSRELTQNKIHKFIAVQAQNTIFFP